MDKICDSTTRSSHLDDRSEADNQSQVSMSRSSLNPPFGVHNGTNSQAGGNGPTGRKHHHVQQSDIFNFNKKPAPKAVINEPQFQAPQSPINFQKASPVPKLQKSPQVLRSPSPEFEVGRRSERSYNNHSPRSIRSAASRRSQVLSIDDVKQNILQQLKKNKKSFFDLERCFVLNDTNKTRMASKKLVQDWLLDNGVKTNQDEIDMLFSQVGGGQKELNYLDFISNCRGQMSMSREEAVTNLFRDIDQSRRKEISTIEVLKWFKPSNHSTVKWGKKTADELHQYFTDNLALFGKLGGYNFKDGVILFDEFLEFFDSYSALEFDDHDFFSLLNDCFV